MLSSCEDKNNAKNEMSLLHGHGNAKLLYCGFISGLLQAGMCVTIQTKESSPFQV